LENDEMATKPKPEAPLRVLIAGCGEMGGKHLRGWRNSGLATVVGAVNRNPERLQGFLKEHDVPHGGRDCEAMIRELRPDVVSVCLPAFMHADATCCAAAAGCHVFCEKPIALTLEDGRRMIDACRGNGVLLGIDFQRRFWGNTQFYREQVAANYFGRPVVWKRLDVREVRPKTLMHEKNGNGGAIVDCAVHWFDQWRTILGQDPVRIYARGGVFGRGKKRLACVEEFAPDTGVITIEYASGDVGELTMCWGLPEQSADLEAEFVIGPNAWASRTGQRIEACSGSETLAREIEPFTHDRIVAEFAKAVLGTGPNPATGEDGLFALRIALAALESIETGQPVDL